MSPPRSLNYAGADAVDVKSFISHPLLLHSCSVPFHHLAWYLYSLLPLWRRTRRPTGSKVSLGAGVTRSDSERQNWSRVLPSGLILLPLRHYAYHNPQPSHCTNRPTTALFGVLTAPHHETITNRNWDTRMVDSSSATLPPTMKKCDYSRISAQEHPTLIGGNTSGRKLLVLDLNGTICHRIANPTTQTTDATSSPPSSSASSSHFSTPSSDSSPAHDAIPKSTRTSHPRPYMPTLLSYLFHPTTKEWLTPIAWSTSKVSSVAEMIEKCFGFDDDSGHVSEDRKGKRKAYAKELAAIWTRESVEGESKLDKKQKKKAEKDLGRIWGWQESGGVPTSSLPLPHPVPLSSTASTSKSKLDGFSQLDTILLDDTPSKAAHQPYNYVPIAKYTKERLLVDYTICGRTLLDDSAIDDPLGDSPIPTEPSSPLGGSVPLPDDSTPPPVIVPPPAGTKYTTAVGEEEPDPSLLAVIGILAALRGVENVSWWIREGRLVDVSYLGGDVVDNVEERGERKEGKDERPWYAIPEVLSFWVARGRKEVNKLGLTVVIYDAEGEHTPIEEDFLPPTTHLPSSSSSASSTSSYSPAFSTYSGHSTSTSMSTSVSECTPPLALPPPLARSPASAGSGMTVRPGVVKVAGAVEEGEGEMRKTVLVRAS